MPMQYRHCLMMEENRQCDGVMRFFKNDIVSGNDIYICRECGETYHWDGDKHVDKYVKKSGITCV